MNLLRGLTTYLIGPIDRCANFGTQWRDNVTPFLEALGVKVLNPNNKKFHGIAQEDTKTREHIEYLKKTGQFEQIRQKYGWIRRVDLRCVDKSDFLIARVDLNVHTCGSYEEISCANRQKKPILCYCEHGKAAMPNWLFFMLPHEYLMNSIEEVQDYLIRVNEKGSPDDRWLFG